MEVDAEQRVIGRSVHLGEGALAGDPGIGDDGVDPAHDGQSGCHAANDARLVGDIDALGMNPAAEPAQLVRRALVGLGATAPDHHVAPGPRQRFGKAQADPRIAAGDERDLAGQIEQVLSHAPLLGRPARAIAYLAVGAGANFSRLRKCHGRRVS